jgi:hypothetical protein
MDKSYIIEPEIINVINGYVFKKSLEVCANLVKGYRGNLTIKSPVYGTKEEYEPGKYRGTCTHGENTPHILHTHPTTSYAYPSVEDILKVINPRHIERNSLIGTKWGIWVISNTIDSTVYNDTPLSLLFEKIKKILDRLGSRTKTSAEERLLGGENSHKSRDLSTSDEDLVSKTINSLSTLLKIKINLYSWSDAIEIPIRVDKNLREYEGM